jgi:hypothetical protein
MLFARLRSITPTGMPPEFRAYSSETVFLAIHLKSSVFSIGLRRKMAAFPDSRALQRRYTHVSGQDRHCSLPNPQSFYDRTDGGIPRRFFFCECFISPLLIAELGSWITSRLVQGLPTIRNRPMVAARTSELSCTKSTAVSRERNNFAPATLT